MKSHRLINQRTSALFLGLSVAFAATGFRPTPKGAELAKTTEAKISRSVLAQLSPDARIPVLVELRDQVDFSQHRELQDLPRVDRIRAVYDLLRHKAMDSQGPLVTLLTERQVSFRRFHISNMIAVWDATGPLVQELAARPDVARVYGNPHTHLTPPTPAALEEERRRQRAMVGARDVGNNIQFTGAETVWNEFHTKGAGIVVAGQDTGVQWNHPALIRQYRGTRVDAAEAPDHSLSWHDAIQTAINTDSPEAVNPCGYATTAPCDDDKHGTHTIGTVVGSDGDVNQIGMAPEAKWIACRNMDAGTGTPASYMDCFEWLLAPYAPGSNPMADGHPEMAPHVINNSWGCPASEGCEGSEMVRAAEAMYRAGIFVVVSAGNDGPDCSTVHDQPATISPFGFSVGALNHRTGVIAGFSSRGPSTLDGGVGPDIVAPGVSIRSSVPGSRYEGNQWSGTSMAGPHVVGAIALMWSARPELVGNIDRTIQLLQSTARPMTSTQSCGGVAGTAIPNNTYGYGSMNVLAAVRAAAAPTESPVDPVPAIPAE